jgi:hypothetical protein
MNRTARLLALIAVLTAPAPGLAVPGGAIGTLEQGYYTCELPGDATGPAGRHLPEADFTVTSASSYRAGGTLGSYLLTGDRLVMTSGPHRGQKFVQVSRGYLRQLNADGSQGEMRCVLGRRNSASPSPCPDRPGDTKPLLDSGSSGREQASCTARPDAPAQG